MEDNPELLDKLVPDEDNHFDIKIVEEVEATETPPDFYSEEWHDYVMRQFRDDELFNGNPVRDGLVRVTEKLLGPIVQRKIVSFEGANADNRGTATVHVRLKIVLSNENHPLYEHQKVIIEDGIAECNSRNTPAPFHMHQAATASSKAEGQALRKILRLRGKVSAEEVTPDDMAFEGDVFMPDEPLSGEQITLIDLLCKRCDISVLDFINCGETKYAFIKQIESSKAQKMIKYLGEIQSGKKPSPVATKKYDSTWRIKDEKRVNNESEIESK